MGRIGVGQEKRSAGIILIEIWMMDGDDFESHRPVRPSYVKKEKEGR